MTTIGAPPEKFTQQVPAESTLADTREITVAHSPDSDDAFMFYGLATNKVRAPGLHFQHTLCDIESLNRRAMEGDGVYDVTAISFHAYPYIQENYALLPSGGSVGEGYGPMIVANRAYSPSEIKGKRIAIPGTLTTAYLALRLFAPGIETAVVNFDQIIPQILEGKYDAGVIIHEGQLSYAKSGLHRIVDLGRWWLKVTGLPLPLGGNAIRRSLGPALTSKVAAALRESIQYALDHREEALGVCHAVCSRPRYPTRRQICRYVRQRDALSTMGATAVKPCGGCSTWDTKRDHPSCCPRGFCRLKNR